MASFNPVSRELVLKVVFCGPGLGGKTTTLERLHADAPAESRGQLVSLATASDRTLFFDFLPLRLPKVRGLHVRLQLFTVPGQVHYAATRKLVLTGTDGIVFVADSQRARMEADVESLEDVESNLRDLGRSLATLPHVMQWNKSDLDPHARTPIEELEQRLNRHGAPSFRTVATTGQGVDAVLEAIAKLTLDAYWASLPPSPNGPSGQQRMRRNPEVAGIATALRDWTEGRSPVPEPLPNGVPNVVPPASGGPSFTELGSSERDLDDLPPLAPRKPSSPLPPNSASPSANPARRASASPLAAGSSSPSSRTPSPSISDMPNPRPASGAIPPPSGAPAGSTSNSWAASAPSAASGAPVSAPRGPMVSMSNFLSPSQLQGQAIPSPSAVPSMSSLAAARAVSVPAASPTPLPASRLSGQPTRMPTAPDAEEMAAGQFSLAPLFSESDRNEVRRIEALIATGLARDARDAVLACDQLVGRALSALSPDRGAAWLLAGLDAGNYRALRAMVGSADRGETISKEAALACLLWSASVAMAGR